jgi:chemotaxis-related protein WspD
MTYLRSNSRSSQISQDLDLQDLNSQDLDSQVVDAHSLILDLIPPIPSPLESITTTFLPDCWNQIGVMGDRSCEELKEVIHCHDCPIYASIGESLLERIPPLNYVEEWISILAEPATIGERERDGALVRSEDAISIVIFRLGTQKLAMPVRILQEITHPAQVKPLPHRSNDLFLGIANIRGETLLCASLSCLLSLETANITDIPERISDKSMTDNTHRMIVAGAGEEKWVFPVDEVYGTYRFYLSDLRDSPVVITKAAEAYTQGIIHWKSEKVNYLDSELMFYTLNHKIL